MIVDKHEHLFDESFIQNNLASIKHDFTWDKIIGQYDHFFQECYLARTERNFLPEPKLVEQLVEAE